jgi:hypothetical protein
VGMWWEPGFEPLSEAGFVPALADALAAHRDFGDLASIAFPRAARHRPLVAALKGAMEVRRSNAAAVGRCGARPRAAGRAGSASREVARSRTNTD